LTLAFRKWAAGQKSMGLRVLHAGFIIVDLCLPVLRVAELPEHSGASLSGHAAEEGASTRGSDSLVVVDTATRSVGKIKRFEVPKSAVVPVAVIR
jgi:hypothetical protein